MPAGSVAIAGELAAVYPTASPGGWHLLGRTDLTLFDVDRDPPALLAPRHRRPLRPAVEGRAMIEVVAVGIATTVQDRGRVGWAHLGVGRSGAADIAAHDLANRLVGNDPARRRWRRAAALRLRLRRRRGRRRDRCARRPRRATAARRWASGTPTSLPAGATLSVGAPRRGLRCYVAVRGGIDVPAVLGSRSRDTLGRIGPVVAAGDRLPIGAGPGHADRHRRGADAAATS